MTPADVERLPVGSLLWAADQGWVRVPGGIAPISLLAQKADGWMPEGEPAASIASEFAFIREGKGVVPTNRTAQRVVIEWWDKGKIGEARRPPPRTEPTSLLIDGGFEAQFLGAETSKTLQGALVETWVVFPQGDRGSPVLQVQIFKPHGQLWQAWTGNFTRARDRELAQRVAAARNGTGVAKEEHMPKIKAKRFPVRKKGPGKGFTDLEIAAAAGGKYASTQITNEYFEQWVYDQLVEASKMPADQVLPLKTADDARKIARNMFQQLEWDTKRDLTADDIERLAGNGDPAYVTEFYKGFHKALMDSVPWLADTLLIMNREIRGGMRHAGAHPITRRPTTHAKLGAPRPGTRVRDYIAVDNRGRKIAGPFKSYADAKDAAGPGGHTQFVPSARAREAPRGVARNVRRGRHRARARA